MSAPPVIEAGNYDDVSDDDCQGEPHESLMSQMPPVAHQHKSYEEEHRNVDEHAPRRADEISRQRLPENIKLQTAGAVIIGKKLAKIKPGIKNEARQPRCSRNGIAKKQSAMKDEQINSGGEDVDAESRAHEVHPGEQSCQQDGIKLAFADFVSQQKVDDNSQQQYSPGLRPQSPRRSAIDLRAKRAAERHDRAPRDGQKPSRRVKKDDRERRHQKRCQPRFDYHFASRVVSPVRVGGGNPEKIQDSDKRRGKDGTAGRQVIINMSSRYFQLIDGAEADVVSALLRLVARERVPV